jgi:NAD(P)-dependent dehydrogenase (short-subunit alcohol dehydrogenase family)
MRRSIKNVIVSGACGGLGAAVTEMLAARGVTVFAADLDAAAPARRRWPPNAVPLVMDVTSSAGVADALRAVPGAAGLDGLVCCAGIFTAGPLVEAREEALSRAFDVNVMGAYRLVREAYPLLARRGGTIVLISSESARFAMPFNGPYTMSKYALEAYADCLRRELLTRGVKVAVIQPGSFRSGLLRNADEVVGTRAADAPFARQLATVRRLLRREWDTGMGAEQVARAVVRALYAEKPRPRYRVGNDPLRVMLRVLPARTADALIKGFMR